MFFRFSALLYQYFYLNVLQPLNILKIVDKKEFEGKRFYVKVRVLQWVKPSFKSFNFQVTTFMHLFFSTFSICLTKIRCKSFSIIFRTTFLDKSNWKIRTAIIWNAVKMQTKSHTSREKKCFILHFQSFHFQNNNKQLEKNILQIRPIKIITIDKNLMNVSSQNLSSALKNKINLMQILYFTNGQRQNKIKI